jgi:hypothetical protein
MAPVLDNGGRAYLSVRARINSGWWRQSVSSKNTKPDLPIKINWIDPAHTNREEASSAIQPTGTIMVIHQMILLAATVHMLKRNFRANGPFEAVTEYLNGSSWKYEATNSTDDPNDRGFP